ncbi:hypothetical protein [Bartonella grahamii]|uniref:hypothetical protein n=1 Tax=Bartonella grahamii TaxID=33045 RepID=UPI002E7AD110|nr:hypothetical protein [Bartonella grahamii]
MGDLCVVRTLGACWAFVWCEMVVRELGGRICEWGVSWDGTGEVFGCVDGKGCRKWRRRECVWDKGKRGDKRRWCEGMREGGV